MRRTSVLILVSFLPLVSLDVLADENARESKETPPPKLVEELSREFSLDGPRASEERWYESVTVMTKVFTDGKKRADGAIRLYV